jgi:hypothetical protein
VTASSRGCWWLVAHAWPGFPFGCCSPGKLALAVFKLAEDVAVAGVPHVLRHPPDVDCPGKAERLNMNDGSVRAVGVPAPVPAVTKYGDPAYLDVDAFRHKSVCRSGY